MHRIVDTVERLAKVAIKQFVGWPLLPPGNPTKGQHPAPKAYTDSQITAVQTSILAQVTPYVSPQQTITTGGTLTLAHGLGAIPSSVEVWLVNQTAELGYTAGQRALPIQAASIQNSVSSAGVGCSIMPDATNLNIRYGSATAPFLINSKTDGHGDNATNANWKALFVARL